MVAGGGWWRMGRGGAGKTTSKLRLCGGRVCWWTDLHFLWKLHRNDGKEFKKA